jgi:molecular chaperone DnaK
VSAKDHGTGKEQKITITSSSGLGEDDIQRMVKDADSNAADDHRRRLLVESRNRLDGIVYSAAKTVEENKEKLSAAELGDAQAAIDAGKQALESEDQAILDEGFARLEKAMHKVAEAMYRGAQTGGEPGPGAGAASDEVIDAEVVDAEKN